MYQLIVFFGYLTIGSISGMSILYCFNKEKFFNISERVSWSSVKCYHKVNNKIKKVLEDLNSKEKKVKNRSRSKIQKSKELYEFVGYHNNNSFTSDINELKERQYFIDETFFDIMFLKYSNSNEVLWKRILNKSELENIEELKKFEKIDKPFLQIEYYQNKDSNEDISYKKTEIHTNMNPFYIKNNKILDKEFVDWYINKYFSDIQCENYELQLIDTNINIFKMYNNKFCLLEGDDGYIIKQDEN
jgi:hypothetical protein|tara:strand:- start:1401 stop:2135 length:735 start_codon:yes stop_codon:yes gene_type:complete